MSVNYGGLDLPELAVCDPLTQEYTLLPPITEDLLASTIVEVQPENIDLFYPFFDPSGDYEEARFKVMCWTLSPEMAAFFVYSSATGSWTHGTSVGWAALGYNMEVDDLPAIGWWPNYAYGCLYWHADVDKLIKLNISSMEFTTLSLPHEDCDIVVVEAGEGRIGKFSLIWGGENLQPLRCSIMQNESDNANEPPVETIVPLPHDYDIFTVDGAAKGYVFLIGSRKGLTLKTFFSLEIKTMKIERLCCLSNGISSHNIPYFGFPSFIYH